MAHKVCNKKPSAAFSRSAAVAHAHVDSVVFSLVHVLLRVFVARFVAHSVTHFVVCFVARFVARFVMAMAVACWLLAHARRSCSCGSDFADLATLRKIASIFVAHFVCESASRKLRVR